MKPTQPKSRSFFGGAAILAASIAVAKLIGALYKIPLGNILDDPGFAYFNNAYAIYNLLLMVATAGLPVAMSKTISEATTLGRGRQVERVFRVSLHTFLALGVLSSLIMLLFAHPLACLQGNALTAPSIRALSLSCFFVCAMASYRGYAQGQGNMTPTGISQVLEASIKLLAGLALAWYLLQQGLGSQYVSAGAIGGVTISGLVALAYLVLQHRRAAAHQPPLGDSPPDSTRHILKTMAQIAIPITICASVVPITTCLDSIQVQNLLQSALGHSPEASSALYGSFQKAVTIYNLPSALMVALTSSIVPAVSACLSREDSRGAGQIAESALRVGALLAMPAGVGLALLSGPIIRMLFPNTNQEVASASLLVLGVASIFVCIQLLCSAILQAHGQVLLPVFQVALGSAAKLAVNYTLVQRPELGVKGAPVGTLVCFAVIALLQLASIRRLTQHPPSYRRVFWKPALAAAAMGVVVWLLHPLLGRFLGNTLAVLGTIAVACLVYAVLVVALRILSKEDLMLMPKGEKLAKLLRLDEGK